MDSRSASPDVPRDPLAQIPCPQDPATKTEQSSTLLGDLYKRLTPPSLTSFLRNPFGQSPRSSSAFLPEIVNKPPRNAWEREKRQGINRKGKKRTVWKRYETKTNTAHAQEDKENVPVNEYEDGRPVGSFNSPKKVLKKVCLAAHAAPAPKSTRRLAVAASYDRRRSGLPHKMRVLRTDEQAGDTSSKDQTSSLMVQNTEQSSSRDDNEAEDAGATEQTNASGAVSFSTFQFSPFEPQQEKVDYEEASATADDSDMSDVEVAEQMSLTERAIEPVSLPTPGSTIATIPDGFEVEAVEDLTPVDDSRKDASDHVMVHELATHLESSDEQSALDESRDSLDHADAEDMASEAVIGLPAQIESPTRSGEESVDTGEDITQVTPHGTVSDSPQQKQADVPAEDDGECMDFTACLEDPTVVGDQYVGTLELRGLTLPSKSEMTDEEASGPEEESPDMLEDDPELFEFLDEKAARPRKSQQSPSERSPASEDRLRTTDSPEEGRPRAQPGEETTTVIVDFNDDENVLTDFISRAKASKAARIAKRTSDTHKRDSDVVKRALASPRKVIEAAEGGSPVDTATSLEAVPETLKPSLEVRDDVEEQEDPLEPSDSKEVTLAGRRSSRRTAAPAQRENQSAPHSVSIRRPGAVVLRRTELQELANQTRTNTRRNKGAAIPAKAMLGKLRALAPEADIDDSTHAIEQRRTVQWNVELVSFFDEEQRKGDFPKISDEKASELESTNSSKPRGRRGNALSQTNGTPAKTTSSSADTLAEESAAAENVASKEMEMEKKIPKRRQIPKPTSRTLTRTQSAALADQANSSVSDTNGVDADTASAAALATKRNALPRTRTSARR